MRIKTTYRIGPIAIRLLGNSRLQSIAVGIYAGTYLAAYLTRYLIESGW